MRSKLLDDVNAKRQARILAMTPAERVALSLRLGQRDRAVYAAAHGVSAAEARAALVGARDRCRT